MSSSVIFCHLLSYCERFAGSLRLLRASQDLLGQVLRHMVPGGAEGANRRCDGAAENASRDVADGAMAIELLEFQEKVSIRKSTHKAESV